MAINYVLTQGVSPKDVTAPRKFYAIANSNGEETVRQLVNQNQPPNKIQRLT